MTRKIFKDDSGEFEYVIVPRSSYEKQTFKVVMEIHDMKVAYSEWWQFYRARFQRCNLDVNSLEVKIPIISLEDCKRHGL